MLFSSPVFLMLFLPCVMMLYYLGRGHVAYQNFILLVFSIVFYGWGEPVFVFIMLFSVAVNFFFGIAIARTNHKKAMLVISITWNLSILFVFKYWGFVFVAASFLSFNMF